MTTNQTIGPTPTFLRSSRDSTLGIDLRCLPADGTPGAGIAHAAHAVAKQLIRLWPGRVVCYVPAGAAWEGDAVRLKNSRRSALAAVLRQAPCDVLFVPSGAVSPGLSVPVVPWVHDADIFDHPEWFPQSLWQRILTTRLFVRGLRRAPRICAVSAYTQQALERLDSSLRGRITVTGEGGDEALAALTDAERTEARRQAWQRTRSVLGRKDGAPRRTVLMLGTLEPRKNIPFVCGWWPEVVAAIPGTDVVIAGADGWGSGPIERALRDCGDRLASADGRLIRLRGVRDNMRRDLLCAADLVLVPSLSEGFGLVALEAMQAGTPVLASRRGTLPEVVGEGAWLLDPEDATGWRDAVIRLLNNPSAREQMAAAQAFHREQFSWERTARVITDTIAVVHPSNA